MHFSINVASCSYSDTPVWRLEGAVRTFSSHESGELSNYHSFSPTPGWPPRFLFVNVDVCCIFGNRVVRDHGINHEPTSLHVSHAFRSRNYMLVLGIGSVKILQAGLCIFRHLFHSCNFGLEFAGHQSV